MKNSLNFYHSGEMESSSCKGISRKKCLNIVLCHPQIKLLKREATVLTTKVRLVRVINRSCNLSWVKLWEYEKEWNLQDIPKAVRLTGGNKYERYIFTLLLNAIEFKELIKLMDILISIFSILLGISLLPK